MGFDNECILNIQSLPGEYFCPVCRTLVYPNEALQTQCTHLYCKPCLAYIVATTCACPYDGYLVSEADAKPLTESNKPTAEAIEKIQVHCLYHRSGCQWQGTLSECITHCTSCNFGSSPVVCNRCGTQIIHRQVQEHAQICPGVQPQAQQADSAQTLAAVAAQNQSVAQPAASATQDSVSQPAAPASVATVSLAYAAAPSSVPATTAAVSATTGQEQGQPSTTVQPQVATQSATTEQWYQQQQLQYQQYYQQYPGYDPYQQHYQQYGYYQQQAHAQYPQAYVQPHPVQGQQQSQVYAQQQLQTQPQAHAQPPQTQVQTHGYPQPMPLTQLPQVQASANLQQPVQTQPQQPQMHPSTQPQVPVQQLGQPQSQAHQPQPQPLPQAQPPHLPQLRPQHQQPMMAQHPPPQIQQQQSHAQYQQQPNLYAHAQPVQQPPLHMHPQPHPRPHSLTQPQPQPQPLPQPQPQHQPQPQPQPQPPHQIQSQPQPLSQPQLQPHPHGQPQLHPGPAHVVTGHQSFSQAHHQQTPPAAATHQHPMHMHPPQQGASHQQLSYPAPMQNQFPHQPPPQPQMRPQPSPVPVQGQQHAVLHSAQGSHMHLLPGQQQTHHLVHPSGQQIHHPPGMQAPPQQPSIPQQQPQGPPHHSQLHHQGSFPPQQPVHPQQGLRPQGHPFMQQHPQLQPPSQTAPRPVPSSHALPQQPFAQTSGGPGIHPQGFSDQKVASVQIVQTGNQGSALPSSPAILQPSVDEKQEGSVSVKRVQAAVEVPTEKKGDVLTDLKEKSESNFKREVHEDKLSDKTEVENVQSVADGEHPASLENDGVSEAKQSAIEEGTSELPPNRVLVDSSVERNGVEGAVLTENMTIERKSDGSDDKSMHGHTQGGDYDATAKPLGTAEKVTQNFTPQGPMYGNERGNMQSQPRQQIPSSALPYDASAPAAHDRAFQPGYADRNMPQFPPHGPIPGDPRGFPPPQMQPNLAPPHAPPYMQDAMSQRPPAPDWMLPQPMPHPGPNQDRMFQEPPPRAMLTQGQPLVPNQMRPSHNFPEILAHQGQLPIIPDPFQAKHPPVNFPVPGSNAPLGRGPNSFGPPQVSQLPGQGQMPPPSNAAAIGPRIPHAEPFAGAAPMNARVPPIHLEGQLLRSHPPNPLETGHYDGRQPDFQRPLPSEHFPRGIQPGNQSNMSAMNGFPGKVPDPSFSQGPIGERFKPLPDERYKSMADEGLMPPGEDRFRPYGADPGRRFADRRDFEEDLKQFPRPSDIDSEAGSKFENYLSSSRPHFDRRSHGLDGASGPFDRGFGPEAPPRIGGTSPVPSRLMPGGHVPVGGVGSLHPLDAMERPRSFGLHDDNMGRKGDLPPDFHRPPPDFGRHRNDSLHPLRSPGRELSGLPSSRFGSFPRFDEFSREQHTFSERGKQHNPSPDSIGLHDKIFHGSGILPSHLRRGENDTLRIGDLPGHMRGGNHDGHDIHPGHMRGDDSLASGSFRSHLHLGDQSGLENVPPHLRSRDFARFGEPGFGSSFPMHGFPNEPGGFSSGSFQGGLDPLDLPRKRKPGSIGWCRICKIDCETVEGLDLHSQTNEHQKMAMDIVLSIKHDNAKKHKLSSEEHEESNKSRKTGFEGRPSRR